MEGAERDLTRGQQRASVVVVLRAESCAYTSHYKCSQTSLRLHMGVKQRPGCTMRRMGACAHIHVCMDVVFVPRELSCTHVWLVGIPSRWDRDSSRLMQLFFYALRTQLFSFGGTGALDLSPSLPPPGRVRCALLLFPFLIGVRLLALYGACVSAHRFPCVCTCVSMPLCTYTVMKVDARSFERLPGRGVLSFSGLHTSKHPHTDTHNKTLH